MKNRDLNEDLPGWTAPEYPKNLSLEGRYAALVPLDATRHADPVHRANSADDNIWNYLPYGPFRTPAQYRDWVVSVQNRPDPIFLAIRDKQRNQWAGVASYLRITPQTGVIEVGHINYSVALQRTRAATEAMYLMMKWVFDAGYRRYEWKCNALNAPSRRAAQRLGFSYEGVFRQATIIKSRNRDTAWFAAIDKDWPDLQAAYETWLSPDNFAADGLQKTSLRTLTAPALARHDPDDHPSAR